MWSILLLVPALTASASTPTDVAGTVTRTSSRYAGDTIVSDAMISTALRGPP